MLIRSVHIPLSLDRLRKTGAGRAETSADRMLPKVDQKTGWTPITPTAIVLPPRKSRFRILETDPHSPGAGPFSNTGNRHVPPPMTPHAYCDAGKRAHRNEKTQRTNMEKAVASG